VLRFILSSFSQLCIVHFNTTFVQGVLLQQVSRMAHCDDAQQAAFMFKTCCGGSLKCGFHSKHGAYARTPFNINIHTHTVQLLSFNEETPEFVMTDELPRKCCSRCCFCCFCCCCCCKEGPRSRSQACIHYTTTTFFSLQTHSSVYKNSLCVSAHSSMCAHRVLEHY
jgi:hypothetical protein